MKTPRLPVELSLTEAIATYHQSGPSGAETPGGP